MNAPLWLQNLASYSVQLALVVVAIGAAARALRANEPRFMLPYWHAALLLALLLPALQPWTRVPVTSGTPESAVVPGGGRSLGVAAAAWPDALALALGLGVLARTCWLGLGLLRLRHYRRRARPVELPEARALARRLGVAAQVAVSPQLEMPVTFGATTSTILLPERLLASAPERRTAVLCHEMLHVRRRDWLATLAEECIRALLWFHPAVAWLLSRIRLTREQLVDREVVALTGDRQAYLEALLDAAGAGAPQPVAALLPRASHFVERVDLLLEEVSMSTKRKLLALGLCAGVLALSSALAVQAFPLVAPAEATTSDDRPVAEGVAGGVPGGVVGGVVGGVQDEPKKAPPEKKSGRKLVYKVNPGFPEGGRKVKAREDVVLSVTIEKSGEISDVKVIKGHPSFNESAVEAVKQWKFEPSEQSPAEATITIRFVPPPPPPPPPKPER